jgi:hypothetical protein
MALSKAAAHLRCSSESALSGTLAVSEEEEEEEDAYSGLRRKPIPLDLFLR